MTVYDARRARRLRPTLRLRLTLLNGTLLVGTAAVLISLAWASGAEREVLLTELAAFLVIGVVGVVAAYWVAGRALRPLQQVTATARRLTGETLDERIRYDGADDEVAELAATFDAMLDRIGAAFDSQKRFVANASHELRTPLAVMRTEIGRASCRERV